MFDDEELLLDIGSTSGYTQQLARVTVDKQYGIPPNLAMRT